MVPENTCPTPDSYGAGIVDKAHAAQLPDVGDYTAWADRGTWFDVQGEYKFGRFGLDKQSGRAHSFLFFTADTQFAHTYFVGVGQRPLRQVPE